MLKRRVPHRVWLLMLVGAWRMADRDDFAVLWHVTRSIAGSVEEKRTP